MQNRIQTELANRLRFVCTTLYPVLNEIPETEMRRIPAPGKWSKLQILGHLIDSAANNHNRFIRSRYEDIPLIIYNQNEWNTLNAYALSDPELVINLWYNYNMHLAFVMETCSDTDLSKLCDTGGEKPYSLVWLMTDYIDHLEHHLKQIHPY